MRVTWTRSDYSILKKINPEHSLEGLILKLKLQHFGFLMRRNNSLEKTLMLKVEGRSGDRGGGGQPQMRPRVPAPGAAGSWLTWAQLGEEQAEGQQQQAEDPHGGGRRPEPQGGRLRGGRAPKAPEAPEAAGSPPLWAGGLHNCTHRREGRRPTPGRDSNK